MTLHQLYLLLVDDCPRSWDRDEMLERVNRLDWTPIGEALDAYGRPCDLKGQFQVEPGGLIRPAPGLKATMWPHDRVFGVHTVELQVYRDGAHDTTFDGIFMVDRLVMGTYDPPVRDCRIGHRDRCQSNCAASNLYWDVFKRAKWA